MFGAGVKIKMDTQDERWWKEWKAKMAKIEELENELEMTHHVHTEKITQAEMDWVEAELKEVDKLYNEMYRKDV